MDNVFHKGATGPCAEASKLRPSSPPLRHCMIVQNYYPFAEVRVQREAEALLSKGHHVHIICRRHGYEPKLESNASLTIHRLSIGKKKWGKVSQLMDYLAFALSAFFKVTLLHIARPFDVVQVHNLPDFLVFSALVPRLTGSRIILDIHDLMPEFYCSRFNKGLNSLPALLLRWQEYLSCRFAHRVITVTELWKKTLVTRSVGNEKCVVVMNLADPIHFDKSEPAETADKLVGTRAAPLRLIYHGTVARRYGVDLLLRA
jgi:glycosyltransferase involved in cell wall biosynthesis